MKKVLGISLVAVLAATPLMARADNELTAAKTIASDITPLSTSGALTTQAYVQGAYNAALGQIRTVNDAVTVLNGNVGQAGSVLKAVKDTAATASFSNNTDYASGTIGYAIKNTSEVALGDAKTYTDEKAAAAVTESEDYTDALVESLEYTTELAEGSTVTGTVSVPTSGTVVTVTNWTTGETGTAPITFTNENVALTGGTVSSATLTTTAAVAEEEDEG